MKSDESNAYFGIELVEQMIGSRRSAEALLVELTKRTDLSASDPLGVALLDGYSVLLGLSVDSVKPVVDCGLLPLAWHGTRAIQNFDGVAA
jgi:hypothetical protein